MSYHQDYGYSRIISAIEKYPNFKIEKSLLILPSDRIFVIVASDKQLKIDAIKKLFELNHRYDGIVKNYVGYKSNSNIADQPIGIENGRLGSLNRIKYVENNFNFDQANFSKSTYICAIENYFDIQDLKCPSDHAYITVQCPNSMQFSGVSDGISINSAFFFNSMNNVVQTKTGYSKTIGSCLGETYGFDSNDWFSEVLPTDSKISRIEQILTSLKLGEWF